MRARRLGLFAFFAFSFLFVVLNPIKATASDSGSTSSVSANPVADNALGAVSTPQVEERSNVTKILDALPDWLQALSMLIAAAASIAALTPSPKDDGALLILRKLIDLLALNFGGAKNASSNKTDKYIG